MSYSLGINIWFDDDESLNRYLSVISGVWRYCFDQGGVREQFYEVRLFEGRMSVTEKFSPRIGDLDEVRSFLEARWTTKTSAWIDSEYSYLDYEVYEDVITNWRAGITPRLDALLRVCFHSKVSVLSFLLETIPTVSTANTSTESNKSNVSSNKKRPPARKLDLKETEEVLKNALTQNPPLCLAHIAKRLGRRAATIRYHFPDLCKAVVDRCAEYEQRCVLSRIEVKRKALQAALADNTHLSTIDVARQLGVQPQNVIKELPDLCKEVSRRHIEGRNNRWFKIGSELNAMLGEWPPPSMGEICKRIGYSRTSLHRHHSPVCYRLAARHITFLHDKLRRRTPSV